ncbi:16S rRNA (adenine(1518)-N(6)/adenine(1519)-N(6))-dimethyltransferase RsmA [Thiospirillum jenense]|uniref:Ribosomal RNA small subunit methyltransferase A n=1 Tax=Thiospirillum jenense TaxID=1653858 RepID=A0A839HEF5_9GAMM|nr:16S rRNA (adenine(1518)-N(6)/adenine(1519)-N(6))-dimethyltransferase RsmA [Thiospirillum jenense]MBB1125399.1 16S rRNA (adenine(1518)-N(6)/adenine(1519)-N(6))-dimethyltransferase RsmA [Thiospirillum jenense]
MNHHPRKRFGQHFLRDPIIINRILALIDAKPGQQLIEIGPGQGALTTGLLTAAGALDVIEIDRDLIEPLAKRCQPFGQLCIHQADALQFDLCTLLNDSCAAAISESIPASSTQRLRLIGNLPYNISTPLLFHFLKYAHCLDDLHLMLQREVVERICAAPGNKTYGRLSVMVQTYCAAEMGFIIHADAFYPPPKVESALLHLRPYLQPAFALGNRQHHATLVATAFAQRRKTLRNSLRELISTAQLIAAEIDPNARAETLTIAEFARLSELTCNPHISP